MFFYKQNTLMNKNFRIYNYFLFFFVQKIFYNFYTTRDIIFHLSGVGAQSPKDSVTML